MGTQAQRPRMGEQWVAYVGPFPFPEGAAASQRVLGVARALAMSECRVVVVAGQPRPDGVASSVIDDRVSCEQVIEFDPRWGALRRARQMCLSYGQATTAWLREQPTLPAAVIVYGASAPFLQRVCRWGKAHEVPVVADVVEWYSASQVGGRWAPLYWEYEYSMRHIVPRCNGVIAISDFLSRYYGPLGRPVVRIPPVLDTTQVQIGENRRQSGAAVSLVYAGMPGRKDLLGNVLRALRDVDPEGKRIRLRIAGPSEAVVQHLFPRYPARAVEVMGRRGHSEVLKLVRESDYSVLLRPDARYAHAGFPTKAVESMACGTPLICNLTSDLGEHVHHGISGMVCTDDSPSACARVLEQVAALSIERHRDMRRAAREQAERAFDFRELSAKGTETVDGVGGGIRTLGHWNHNPALYQLSYTHREVLLYRIKR